ncbi:MAG: hypothetical protein ACYTGM_12950 [Planctomycetota bacterium]
MSPPRRRSSFLSSMFASAHAFLSSANAWMTNGPTVRPETGKFKTARCVEAP